MDDGVHGDRGKRYRRPRRSSKTHVVAAIGRTLIAIGVLILLFVAYELWGTGLHEARAQHKLRKQLADLEQQFSTSTTTAVTVPGEPTTTTTVPLPPPTGDAAALIRIPKIGVDKAVVQGVGVADLKKGPGHYPGTPMPGQPGNAAIAGHRTTYGAPFYHLDDLKPGDPIEVTTRQGRFFYKVDYSKTVDPGDVSVLAQTPGAHLTLTTCTPRFSASHRLVVVAELTTEPAPAPPPTTTTTTTSAPSPGVVAPTSEATTTTTQALSESLAGDPSAAWPTALWGALAGLVALLAWLAGRRWTRWIAYPLGAPLFLVVLFVCYENVARLLPANI